jgi:catechol 2,3-dioxygenase-like lactoylglutathione lyase family enzyme
MSSFFTCTDAIVTIATANMGQILSFYTQLLEQQPIKLIPNVYAEFQFPNLRLGIFQPQASHRSEFTDSRKGTISLCLEVSDLEVAIAHLKNLGYAPPGQIITANHGREIYAYDPDGNRLILHQSTSGGSGGVRE